MIARESRRSRALAAIASIGLWLSCTGAAPIVPAESLDLRVATIGYRLATAGAARGSRLAPQTGLLLHDLAAYDEGMRPAVAAQYGLTDGLGVMQVVAGSVAEEAGLQAQDEIVGLDETPVSALPLPSSGRAASYDRIDGFTGLLTEALAKGPAKLLIRRGESTRGIELGQRLGCAARVALLPGDSPKAWSDGRYAVVTQALVRAADDDELAFALAHEMAHVALGHAAIRRPALAGLGIAGRKTRERELEADRLGTRIMMEAGFATAGAETFLDRLARVYGRLSLTHPSFASRITAIRQTAEEVASGVPSR
jgi:Peptidase family M48